MNVNRATYPVNINAFLKEDAISYYLLGSYMTDGNVITKPHNKRFSICSKDLDWIEDIRTLVCPSARIAKMKNSNTYVLSSSNQQVLNWLVSYGCVPNKSKTLYVCKPIPTMYYRDFIRGVLDGDGSISYCKYSKSKNKNVYSYYKKSTYICSASKLFLEQLQEMLPPYINSYITNVGMCSSMFNGRMITATCDMFRLCTNDSNTISLLNWIYYPDHGISLRRKRLKASEILLL